MDRDNGPQGGREGERKARYVNSFGICWFESLWKVANIYIKVKKKEEERSLFQWKR